MLLLVAVCLCLGCQEAADNGAAQSVTDANSSTEEAVPAEPGETSIEQLIAEAVDASQLRLEGDLALSPKTGEPFTGWAKRYIGDSEQIASLEQFKEGKPNGRYTQLYENGQMSMDKTEVLGPDGDLMRVGKWTTWYESGQKQHEVSFKDGKQDGLETYWHENGQKAGEVVYRNGQPDGLVTVWYETGQKMVEIMYEGGKVLDETRWDENGEVIVTKEDVTETYPDIAELVRMIEANGDSVQERLREAVDASQLRSKDRIRYLVDSDAPFTGWTKHYDKGFLTLKQWSDGRGDGPELSWYSNGRKRSAITVNNGKIEGRFTMWHEDGWKSQEGNYKDGDWDGKETKWYSNGQKKSESTYKDGKRIGKQIQWDEDGNVISE